jgi:hypothetical protein
MKSRSPSKRKVGPAFASKGKKRTDPDLRALVHMNSRDPQRACSCTPSPVHFSYTPIWFFSVWRMPVDLIDQNFLPFRHIFSVSRRSTRSGSATSALATRTSRWSSSNRSSREARGPCSIACTKYICINLYGNYRAESGCVNLCLSAHIEGHCFPLWCVLSLLRKQGQLWCCL